MRVLDLGGPADPATWHPQGNRILFRGLREPDQAISPCRPTTRATAARVAVTTHPQRVRRPARGGLVAGRTVDRLTCAGDPDLVGNALHVVAADGSGDRVLPVTCPEILPMGPRWSPDGTWILAKAWTSTVVASVDGPAVRAIGPPRADDTSGIADFARSPDGRMIAAGPHYTSSRPPTGRSASTIHGSS